MLPYIGVGGVAPVGEGKRHIERDPVLVEHKSVESVGRLRQQNPLGTGTSHSPPSRPVFSGELVYNTLRSLGANPRKPDSHKFDVALGGSVCGVEGKSVVDCASMPWGLTNPTKRHFVLEPKLCHGLPRVLLGLHHGRVVLNGDKKGNAEQQGNCRRGLDRACPPIDMSTPVDDNALVRFHQPNSIRGLRKSPHRNAYTLLEVTLVIGIVVGLSAVTIFGLGNFSAMARASRAEAAMRMVESARLSFLSDNPQIPLSQVTEANLGPYIPGGFTSARSILQDNGYDIATPADLRTPRIGYRFRPGTTVPLKGFESR